MTQFLILIAVLVLLAPVRMALSLISGVAGLRRAFARRHDATAEHRLFERSTHVVDPIWAGQNRFRYVGAFDLHTATAFPMIVWRHEPGSAYLCIYFIAKDPSVDIFCEYADGLSLATTNMASGHAFPRREFSLLQVLPGQTVEGLWTQHVAAETLILQATGRGHATDDTPFEVAMAEGVRKQGEFLRSFTLWPVRVLYWLRTRPGRWNNLTIAQQLERGMIRLPERAES